MIENSETIRPEKLAWKANHAFLIYLNRFGHCLYSFYNETKRNSIKGDTMKHKSLHLISHD